MITHSKEKLIERLSQNKDNIFTWINVGNNSRISVRITYENAVKWVDEVCLFNKENKQIPAFFGTNEIFLGTVEI